MPELPHDSDCIFCKIVAGDIPCHKVYENDHVLAFLDVGPLSRGHTLLIPKGHWTTIMDMPTEPAAAIGAMLPQLSAAVMQAVDPKGINVLQNNSKAAGQVVGHVHFHLIPRAENDDLGFRWPAGELSDEDAAELKQAIADKLG